MNKVESLKDYKKDNKKVEPVFHKSLQSCVAPCTELILIRA